MSLSQTTIEKLGGQDLTDYFPVQVSALCNGVDGTVSPWVTLEATNVSTAVHQVAQYHDFRAFTSDSRPDWYYESAWARHALPCLYRRLTFVFPQP